jgi:hypothetical protein
LLTVIFICLFSESFAEVLAEDSRSVSGGLEKVCGLLISGLKKVNKIRRFAASKLSKKVDLRLAD